MPGARAEKFRFDLGGGTVALDFVNTVDGMRGMNAQERLLAYEDLVFWAEQARLVDRMAAARLYAEAERQPRNAEEAFGRAILTREAFNDLVVAALEGDAPPETALAIVNAWIAEALAHRRLRPSGRGGFEPFFTDDGDLLSFLRPAALDAEEVLARELGTGLVRRCEMSADGECGWVFLDTSRNHTRRYCSVGECGNRGSQRRQQKRRRVTS